MMKISMLNCAVYLAIALGCLAPPSNAAQPLSVDFAPSWTIGQKWQVDVYKMSEAPSVPPEQLAKFKPRMITYTYEFGVEDSIEIDGENCFKIRIHITAIDKVVKKSKPIMFHCIYLREADKTLKMLERIRVDHLQTKVEIIEVAHKYSQGAVDVTDFLDFLPMAVPTFSSEQSEREIPTRLAPNGQIVFAHLDRFRQSEKVEIEGVGETCHEILQIILEGKSGDGTHHRTTQKWIKGLPWWKEAKYERDGKEWCSAKLRDNDILQTAIATSNPNMRELDSANVSSPKPNVASDPNAPANYTPLLIGLGIVSVIGAGAAWLLIRRRTPTG
jgi:hypothetical protein